MTHSHDLSLSIEFLIICVYVNIDMCGDDDDVEEIQCTATSQV